MSQKQLRWNFEFPTSLESLDSNDDVYSHLQFRFLNVGWQHPGKLKPVVRSIFRICLSEDMLFPYFLHRDLVDRETAAKFPTIGNSKLRFHGTTYRCWIGDSPSDDQPCLDPECSLCCIMTNSFSISKSGARHHFQRFGRGIYATKCSSKADDYVTNACPGRRSLAMLVTRIVLGKSLRLERNAEYITEPPFGFHSIVGVPGDILNYPENVVYTNNAVRPAFLIVYEPPEGSDEERMSS